MIESIFPDSVIIKRDGDLFFRAAAPGRHAGFLHLGKRNGMWAIAGIGVVPELRGMGYGTEIIAFAIEIVRKMLGHSLALSVDMGNADAIRIYSRMGFRKAGKGGKRTRMVLVLNS